MTDQNHTFSTSSIAKAPPQRIKKIEKLVLLFNDASFLLMAYVLGIYFRFGRIQFEFLHYSHFYVLLFLSFCSLYVFELYTHNARLKTGQIISRIFGALLFTLALFSLVLYIAGPDFFIGPVVGRGILIGTFASFAIGLILSRLIFRKIFKRIYGAQSCLIVAQEDEIEKIRQAIPADTFGKIDLLTIDQSTQIKDIVTKIKEPYTAIVAGETTVRSFKEELKEHLIKLRLSGLNILLPFEFYERIAQKIPVELIDQEWTLRYGGFSLLSNPFGMKIKRLFDILVSIILLIITLPIFIVLPLIMKIFERGDIFYSQIRVGVRGQHFKITKFRTMIADAEKDGAQWAQSGDMRITKLGRFLRKTRIDELPQLFCVLKGDMTLIGPRPERPEFTSELTRIIPFYDLRHLVRPGVTGWAQVKYPYGASVEDAIRKLEFDLYYIKNYSFLLDMIILLKTVRIVFARSGQ